MDEGKGYHVEPLGSNRRMVAAVVAGNAERHTIRSSQRRILLFVNSRPTMYQGSSPRVYQRWSAKVYQARLGNRCETIELTGQVNRRLLKASGWLMYSHDRPC